MGALLALVLVAAVVFVSRGVPGNSNGPEAPALDGPAQRACALFAPIASDVRDGRLTGPPLFRALQDVFNEARLSKTEGFGLQVQSLYSTAIGGDRGAIAEGVNGLQTRCAGGED